MDVQTENTDPPPNESQPSGKIRKGFKLFGKRKPGNIFSIRSKGDGNNKSPAIKSKTLDGLSETSPDSEQDADKEKGQEESQGEMEQAEDEALGEDGVLAAAPARTSISSVSSAKSLSFLSLLRGGRRGVGDRRVQTVSQPVGRQRRGLKGLFGNVKLRSKDKEDKEEAPPSPLLMSSRANSVEIIKEDLTLTPKCRPRSLDSPETERSEPVQSSITHDSAATSPSETTPPRATAGNVSKTNDHVPPLPTSEPPLVPGDNSLSSLLADISSLLTFDSISGGGDIMADVEAEWGKASSPIRPPAADVTPLYTSLFTKSTISSSPVSTAFSTAAAAKPSFVSIPSSTMTKPSITLTSFTKSSTLTSHSVKLTSDSTPASAPSATIKVNLTSAPTTTKPSTTPVTLTSFSAPVMSSALKTTQSTMSSISTPTTAPPSTTSAVVKAPSITPSPPFSASKLASEITLPSQNIVSVSKPSPVASSPASAKPPVTHSPPIPVTQPPPVNLDSVSSLNQQKYTSYKPSQSFASGESKAPMSVSVTCAVTTKPSSPATDIFSKMTSAPIFTTASGSVSPSLPKPTITPTTVTLNNTPPSLVTVSDPRPSSTLTATNKIQPSPPSVSAPSSTLDKTPPTTKTTTASVSLDKKPISVATTHAVSAASPTPTTLGQITVSPASANIQISVSKELPAPTQMEVSQSKSTPAPAQVTVSVTKEPPASVKMQATSPEPPAVAKIVVSVPRDPTAPVKMQAILSKDPPAPSQTPVSVSTAPPAPSQTPVSVSKAPPAPSQTPVSVSKDPPAPSQTPVSVSKDPPAPSHPPVSVSKAPPAPSQTPVSVSKDLPAPSHPPVSVSKAPPAPSQTPVSVSKAPPAPAQIPPSLPKDPPAPVSIPVSAFKAPPVPAQIPVSLPKTHPAPMTDSFPATSPPAPLLSEAPISAKMKGSGQALVDHHLACPESQAMSSKTKELANESQVSLQGPSKDKRPPQVKASGLSKIPVVGGGRVGKLPVRDNQNANDEPSRDPPTPVLEERPHFNSHDAGSKDKISTIEANVATSKHTQEESQQPQQPRVLTSSARDSKIPVKHGTQSYAASQLSQNKEPPRTKIPISKVPVRKAGSKPAPTGGGTQIRK